MNPHITSARRKGLTVLILCECLKGVSWVSGMSLEGVWMVFKSEQVKSGQVMSGQVMSGQVKSVLADPTQYAL